MLTYHLAKVPYYIILLHYIIRNIKVLLYRINELST